jgi:signal transduction histidine kinase
VLTGSDDGTGFDMDAQAAAPAGGHVGLRRLRDLAHAAGGTRDVVSSPGAGRRVRLEVPQR